MHSSGLQTFQSGKPTPCRPLSLPGGAQRGFGLRPTVNFPEREACALPIHCPCLEHRERSPSAVRQTFHSRAGSLRLTQPLSLPGGAQRGFALCPTVNFPELEAWDLPGLSKVTDRICGDNRRIAQSDSRAHRHPQHGALSSSECACECGPPHPPFSTWKAGQPQQSLKVHLALLHI